MAKENRLLFLDLSSINQSELERDDSIVPYRRICLSYDESTRVPCNFFLPNWQRKLNLFFLDLKNVGAFEYS